MFAFNSININTLNSTVNSDYWLTQRSVSNNLDLSSHYVNICQQHHQENKWVLFINPNEASLDQLTSFNNVDTSKVLCVNFNNSDKKLTKINIEQIKKALNKGNCSAIISSNTSFENEDLLQLDICARESKTQFVILKSTHTIH